MIYKFTPNTRTYWRYIWPGALLAASSVRSCSKTRLSSSTWSIWPTMRESTVPWRRSLVLLAWTYVSSLILIAGAEFSSEYERMKLGLERGRVIIDRHPDGT